MTAQKILIIGPSGSGKSYLARKLSAATSIPQTPLDDVNWNNDGAALGIKRDESDRAARLDLVLQPVRLDYGRHLLQMAPLCL